MNDSFSTDEAYMQQALDLAREGLGRVWPNPAVGCVVIKDGVVVGAARTADGGRPHAEPQALATAGDKAQGATVYVTLEPCNTHGKTPPCVGALINARVARVVIACRDPFQKGRGAIEALENAGIIVDVGVLEDDAAALNEGFFRVVMDKRPLVTAKIATSLDGKIATRTGESQWITGEEARYEGHKLRVTHDAVLCGIGTVLADDPTLSARLDGCAPVYPVRIVIDRDLKMPLSSNLLQTLDQGAVWVVCGPDADQVARDLLTETGVKLIELPVDVSGIVDASAILKALAAEGITRLMIEGGGITVSHFLRAGAVDRLYWFRAPKLIGGDGVDCLGALGVEAMGDILCLKLEERREIGRDQLEIYRMERG